MFSRDLSGVPPHTRYKIAHKYRVKTQNGWRVAHVSGSAYDRGFAHGFFLKDDLNNVLLAMPAILDIVLHIPLRKFMHASNTEILPVVRRDFRELYDECLGIVAGARAAGVHTDIQTIIAWNAYESLCGLLAPAYSVQKCSAFIAVGDATRTRDIVMAHNTHTNYAAGALENVVLYVDPDRGAPFVMQTAAGRVSSVTDWFVSASGMVGCETTISGIAYRPQFGAPVFCRIRSAIQYGASIDDYVRILGAHNAGDYACSWLVGDTNTNEIALIEMGLNGANVQRTRDGVFYGMNSAIGHVLRRDETRDRSQFDIQTSSGARKLRFEQLLFGRHYGDITENNAKDIIADHCDVYLRKTRRDQRSVCTHHETAHNARNYPAGSIDGKVVTTKMARNLQFAARWGAACGRAFSAKSFIHAHPRFREWTPVLADFPAQPWTIVRP
jgi:hypothetical protein